jgi:hypothetical protein
MVEINDEERLRRAVRSLRNMIRDKRVLNQLLLGNYETSDEEMKQAIVISLIDWNSTPPIISMKSLADHPRKDLLLKGAAIECMTGAGIWHSREHMPSADGGTSADDHAKAGEYSGWIQRFYEDYEKKKSDYKTAENIREAYGQMGLPSEYSGTLTLYGELW